MENKHQNRYRLSFENFPNLECVLISIYLNSNPIAYSKYYYLSHTFINISMNEQILIIKSIPNNLFYR